MNAYLDGLRRYFDFKGRSTRSQYWLFVLVALVLEIVALVVDSMLVQDAEVRPITGLLALAHLIPSLSVAVRRLHDINRSGWWVLIAFVPLVGAIVLIVFLCTPTQPGPNRFGQGSIVVASTPTAARAPEVTHEAMLDQLDKLAKLKSSGAIDQAEFDRMKADLLSRDTGKA